jgi:hypothetical protein
LDPDLSGFEISGYVTASDEDRAPGKNPMWPQSNHNSVGLTTKMIEMNKNVVICRLLATARLQAVPSASFV